MTQIPYYGTYHHTTPDQSEVIRSALKTAFIDIFRNVENPDSVKLILDAGCGLGYLSEIAANFFDKSSVLGVDIFGSRSLPDSDIEIAKNNMKFAGLGDRVNFKRDNLCELGLSGNNFDLVVSNLVFHNLGKKRFIAYSNIISVLKHEGYFVIGDFFSGDTDRNFLDIDLKFISENRKLDQMPSRYSIMLFRKK